MNLSRLAAIVFIIPPALYLGIMVFRLGAFRFTTYIVHPGWHTVIIDVGLYVQIWCLLVSLTYLKLVKMPLLSQIVIRAHLAGSVLPVVVFYGMTVWIRYKCYHTTGLEAKVTSSMLPVWVLVQILFAVILFYKLTIFFLTTKS